MFYSAYLLGCLLAAWRSNRASRETIERRRRRKFKRLVEHVYRRSPYYRRIIDERRIDRRRATPADFPVLTKAALLEHFDEIVAVPALNRRRIEQFLAQSHDVADRLDGRYVVLHTSGISGVPGFCAYDIWEFLRGWIQFARATGRCALPRRSAFLGATAGHYAAVSMAQLIGWLGLGWVFRVKHLNLNLPWEEILRTLNEYQPTWLGGYAAALDRAAAAQRSGALRIRPRQIASGGEFLSEAVRVRVESAFGVPVIDVYAATETLMIAFSLPGHEEFVLLEDDLWLELRDDHLLATNLFNWTTPLIRYRLDDAVAELPHAAPPTLFPGFRRLKPLVGRAEEMLVLENERGADDGIHPCVIAELYAAGMAGLQVERLSAAEFVFRMVPAAGLSSAERENLCQDLHRQWDEILTTKRMRNVCYRIELVEKLLPDPVSGKFRLVQTGPASRVDAHGMAAGAS